MLDRLYGWKVGMLCFFMKVMVIMLYLFGMFFSVMLVNEFCW